MSSDGRAQAQARMRARGVDDRAVAVFGHYYDLLESGVTGTIPEDTIEPLGEIAALGDFHAGEDQQREALARTAVIKLNGGLGTSMGLAGPKTALEVRDGLTFLDVIARQVLALRARYGVQLPLVLMDSFRTRGPSLEILERYDLTVDGLPLDFLQNAEPKLRADDLTPVDWPADPSLEWCPPGHGDVYLSLLISGVLPALREKGIRYAFLSNADNLGATCDPQIAAWLIANDVPYCAEVCQRTPMDLKGGHLARRRSDGQVVLRDSAMVVPGEEHFFTDPLRHRTFHTNNLWVDLDVIARLLEERGGVLGLPIIVNRKTVDPARKDSTPVIQIETGMGTAVETITGAQPLEVPRSRFRPVKTTSELALLRSDVYRLDQDSRIVPVGDGPDPVVSLGEDYRLIDDFERYFADGVPSLAAADSFSVRGPVTFGRGVGCRGEVAVTSARPATIPAGTVLQGQVEL